MRRRALLLPAAAAVVACAGGDAGAPPQAPAFELCAVVDPAIATLEAELAREPRAAVGDTEDAAELARQARGLVDVARSAGQVREVALEEAALVGLPLLPHFLAIVDDPDAEEDARAAALELVATIDTPATAEALLVRLESAAEGWVRAHAAWRLGGTSQEWVVPRVLLRLKYEKDHQCVIWIADCLSRFGNHSGLGPLAAVAADSPHEANRTAAGARLAAIAADTGFDDATILWQAWLEGDPALAVEERGARFRVEVWRWIGRFREFQLRGVDDGRYVLESLGAAAARLLAEALHDENLYVRVHSAQSLERMGPRGAVAGPELAAALAEPALAPGAAAALGSVRWEGAETELLARLAADAAAVDPELRLACARSLGHLGETATPAATEALRALRDGNSTLEMRQAACESLARLGAGDEVAAALADFLISAEVEPASSARALRHWLAARDDAAAEEALAAWDALEPEPLAIVPTEERSRIRAERRALVRALLAGDGG